jgi:ubiquinone/menaquinone biosynthesis C-methylase UbiE
MTADPTLSRAFERTAASYERARPGYAPAAIEHLVHALGIGPGRRVLDLAAGTGKLTRQLVATGAGVVAVEPGAAMRAQFAAVLPDVPLLDGTAEAIPLPDASVDAITVAQAFHWFDVARAVPELARVLIPGGGLALVWNERDERVPWVAELSGIIHRRDPRAPFDIATDWATRIAPLGLFAMEGVAHFPFTQPMTAALVEDAALSRSYIAAMEPAEREPILAAVRALVRGWPEPFDLPYVTQVWIARPIPLTDKRR